MQVVFIRHGEPDKEAVDTRGFVGMGRDMAPLTERGIRQAEEAARDARLTGAQVILSSPYTRALQTAAAVSRYTGLDLRVEVDLHEFIPDLTYRVRGEEASMALHRESWACEGEYPPGETRLWEPLHRIVARTRAVLDRYLDAGYDKIIVVAHGGVIRRYTGEVDIGHGSVSEMEYTRDFACFGWI